MEHHYIYEPETNSMIVEINKKVKLLLNPKDLVHIHFTKSKHTIPKWFVDEDRFIYTPDTNYNKIYLLEIIYGYSIKDYHYFFKDENMFNYKSDNIITHSKLGDKIPEGIKIIEEYDGHIKSKGKSANKFKNTYWRVRENDEVYYLMYCDTNAFTKISIDCIDKVLSVDETDEAPTWFRMKNGYIGTHLNNTIMYLHALLMNHYGQGKGQMSVDHINRDKLDNRLNNLRIVNQSEQNKNTDKRNRKWNAQPLPKELGDIKLPKFVTYNIERRNGEFYRDFFRIEKHPNLEKVWSSTKSMKISINEKLDLTKKKLYSLENNIKEDNTEEKNKLPKSVYETIDKRTNKKALVYDRRVEGTKQREIMKYTMKLNLSLYQNLEILKQKVFEKYKHTININPTLNTLGNNEETSDCEEYGEKCEKCNKTTLDFDCYNCCNNYDYCDCEELYKFCSNTSCSKKICYECLKDMKPALCQSKASSLCINGLYGLCNKCNFNLLCSNCDKTICLYCDDTATSGEVLCSDCVK